jgi:hypothetical protein
MPLRLALLSLLLAAGLCAASNVSNHTVANTTTVPYTQFLSCCSNDTQPAAVCLDASFNTSDPGVLRSQFMRINRAELGLCPLAPLNATANNTSSRNATAPNANATSSNATAPNNSSCVVRQKSLDCFNSSLMNDVCAATNTSGSQVPPSASFNTRNP